MVLHSAWLQKHATKVYTRYRGKCVVIAGEELFAADIPEEAWGLAATAHPEDEGSFMRYIPCETVARICANHRCGETSRGDSMTYDVILRKQQNKYIARVRDWPEVM